MTGKRAAFPKTFLKEIHLLFLAHFWLNFRMVRHRVGCSCSELVLIGQIKDMVERNERKGKECIFNINLAFSCCVFVSQAVVEEECMPVDQFVEHLLPSLLSLASDPVPNVRVLLAKALRQTLLEKGVVLNFLGKIQHLGNAGSPLPAQLL